jgi:AcrR family transcriptional regulator
MLDLLRAHGRIYELVPSGGAPQMGRVPALRGAQPKLLRFSGMPEALRFVRDLIRRDAGRMRDLRRALLARPIASDDEVLEELARALVTGRVRLHEQPEARAIIYYEGSEIAEEQGVLAPEDDDFIDGAIEAEAPPDELEPAIAAEMEPDELEPYIGEEPLPQRDVEVGPDQINVLRAAAQTGAPFCEECEKAKQEAENAAKAKPTPAAAPPPAAAEPPPVDAAAQPQNVNEAAQTASMKDAAAEGAPFCEECAKAEQEEKTS